MVFFLEELQVGSLVSIRASKAAEVGADGCAILCSVRGWCVYVDAALLGVPGDGLHFTLINFVVSQMVGHEVLLVPGAQHVVLGHAGDPCYHDVIELCCGLGGMSSGVQYVGLNVKGAADCSPGAVKVYGLNHQHATLLGDLSDLSTVVYISPLVNECSLGFLLGFPCPPFSSRGEQKGFADSRAWTFVHGLDIVYLLKGSFMLLECTPHVESFPELVSYLDLFGQIMGFRWYPQILHLYEAWPARRTRWWCLVLPEPIGCHLALADLPRASHLQSVDCLLPARPAWSPAEVADLVWSQEFHENLAVLPDLILQINAQCPTLLHSLGHLDRSCPCWCRQSGLSMARLSRDGISAVALRCDGFDGSDGFPHRHPQEAGFFGTLPPGFCYPKIRESLPLIGQPAAPLQAHWMLTHLASIADSDEHA